MAYKNSGYQRATTLTIIVKLNGVESSTVVLPLKEAFTQSGVTYPAVTSDEIAKMSSTDYFARTNAYAAYIQANYQTQFPGLTVSATGAQVYNVTACPLT